MNDSSPIPLLERGDLLGYDGNALVSDVIEAHTGGPLSHVECYIGHQQSVASRDGKGVGQYPLRVDGLVAVLRPKEPFDFDAAMTWFQTVNGYDYDFTGLLNAITPTIIETPKHLFCSAFSTLWYRAGAFDAAHAECPAVKVVPIDYLKFPGFKHILCPPGW